MLPKYFEAMRERFSTEYDPDPGGPGWKLQPESLEKRECLAAMDVMWEAWKILAKADMTQCGCSVMALEVLAKVEAMGDDKS